MSGLTKCVLVFFAFFTGWSVLEVSGSPMNSLARIAQQGEKRSDTPVLDYEAETRKTVSRERKEKNSRFNGRGYYDKKTRIAELPGSIQMLPTITHWWVRLPALPVSQSDVIVLGEVVEAEAHLSDDQTGIYSEFTMKTEEFFKDTTGSLSPGNTITANRIGGGVRFASGKIQEYRIFEQGMPLKGNRYVLFLKHEESGDFSILTGYRLSNGRITPLDGSNSDDPASGMVFSLYKGVDESQFLQELRTAIQ